MDIENEIEKKGNDTDYLKIIDELKNNRVDKASYEKALEENRRLANMLLNANTPEEEKKQEVVYTDADIKALSEKLFSKKDCGLNNLEFCETALELRKAIFEKSKGKTDIFVGRGSNFEPTQNDYYRAENTAEVIKECIEFAEGDSSTFTSELMKRCKR